MTKQGSRLVGGVLLVAGTTIGAGMLAIPVASSFAGFFPSFALLIAIWLFFFATAWILLDANLSCPNQTNFLSMVEKTLGGKGKVLCWINYLLLLYSLTAAYIAGSAPLFLQAFHALTGYALPAWLGPLPLFFLFGIFVYLGTSVVDKVNRLLMFCLIASYLLLIGFLAPHVDASLLRRSDTSSLWMAVPLFFTSYGFHIIIPTLTTYLRHDVKRLRLAIAIGSLLPFLVYALWNFLVLGVVPLDTANGLASAWAEGESALAPLQGILVSAWIGPVASAFSFFAIVTSFLGVSLSLSDFLADGLKIRGHTWGRELACLLTFIPPLLFVYTYPGGFLLALRYAGLFVAVLLCIFPALMAWRLPRYRSLPCRILLIGIIVIAVVVVAQDLTSRFG